MSAGAGWIEVGRNDCRYCDGTGIRPPGHEYPGRFGETRASLRRRYGDCPYCHGKGSRSVGFSDLRDASGR
jgi:RecJ-like exonuclease